MSQRAAAIEEITNLMEILHTLDREQAAKLCQSMAQQIDRGADGMFSQIDSDDSL